MKRQIGNVEVEAREWKGKRIYFTANTGGQACWDTINKRWIKVRGEFGGRFKNQIKRAFNL
jgi:hypothetical protein